MDYLKPNGRKKMNNYTENEEIAYMELKGKIVTLMFDFTNKHAGQERKLYPQCINILIDVLTDCLSDAQYQTCDYFPFTDKQRDHICYQIGDWYLMMKPLLEDKHNLGYMKEVLKKMICGE